MTQMRSGSRPKPPSAGAVVDSSQAYPMASSLKWSPKEKLPFIWKNEPCRVVLPTSSMSRVRTHLCTLVARGHGGAVVPVRYALKGTMPALTKSSVGSGVGRGALGTTVWPRAAKWSRKRLRMSAVRKVAAPVGGSEGRSGPTDERVAACRSGGPAAGVRPLARARPA